MSYPPPYGNPNDPQQGGTPQYPQQPGNYPQYPQQPGGYPQQPQPGGYPQQYPQQPQPGGYPPQQPFGSYQPAPQLQPVARKRNPLGLILGIVAAVVIIAVVAGSLIYTAGKSSQDQTATYSAAKPGLGCDKGEGKWQTLPSGESGTCQADGYLFARTSDPTKIAEAYFMGKNGANFAQSYRVSVDATIQTGDLQAGVGLNVHVSKNGGDGQVLLARENGNWSADTESSTSKAIKLAEGFLPDQTKTLHIEVQVQGAVLTFSVNNKVVTTVTDVTYTKTSLIGLVVSDPGNTDVSALFSNFVYTPGTETPISDADAAATATATTQDLLTKPYTAAVPGAGCDTGNGAWQAPATYGDTNTTLKCTGAGLTMTQPAGVQTFAFLSFYGPQGRMANDYALSVQYDLTQNKGGCAGLATRGSDATNGYLLFIVCSDGLYDIVRFPGSSSGSVDLKNGAVAAKAVQTIKVTAKGSSHTLVVGGKTIATITDTTLTTTDYVGLVSFNPKSLASSTTFKNFVYTPSK